MKTSVGSAAPSWARKVKMVIGRMVTDDALMTMNRIWSLVARSGSGLSVCSSRIALSPSGVAALSSPSMLADMFITIAPPAGCPSGMPGNRRRNSGRNARAIASTTPPFSPIRISPSHRLITPVSPSAISKPVFAESNSAPTTSRKTSGRPRNTRLHQRGAERRSGRRRPRSS